MKKITFELLRALKERGLTQRQFAEMVEDHETIVSRVINGIWVPDEVQKGKYANALHCSVEDLFSRRA